MVYVSKSILLWGSVISCLACAWGRAYAQTDPEPWTEASKQQKPAIVLAIGLVWEGQDLQRHNLKTLEDFRRRYPRLPFIQYFNPAYFLKGQQAPEKVQQLIRQVVLARDIAGLHLHPWKRLVESCGLVFRSGPTFWGNLLEDNYCQNDCGHEVPLSVYRQDEVESLLRCGQKLLGEQGIAAPKIFSAGGWMASAHVLEAVKKVGFSYDASPVPWDRVASKLKYYPLANWLQHQWGELSYPYQPRLYYTSIGPLRQLIQNGGSLDYQSDEELFALFVDFAKQAEQGTKGQRYFLHYGLYQETAWQQIPRLHRLIQRIRQHAKERQISLKSLRTLTDLFSGDEQKKNIMNHEES